MSSIVTAPSKGMFDRAWNRIQYRIGIKHDEGPAVQPDILIMDNSGPATAMAKRIDTLLQSSRSARMSREPAWTRGFGLVEGRFDIGYDQAKKQYIQDEIYGTVHHRDGIQDIIEAVAINYCVPSFIDRISQMNLGSEMQVRAVVASEKNIKAAQLAEQLSYCYVSPEIEVITPELVFWTELIDRTAVRPRLIRVAGKQFFKTTGEDTGLPAFNDTSKGRVAMLDQNEPQLSLGGKSQFYEKGDDGKPKASEFPYYELRLDVIPPHTTYWDCLNYTPSNLRRARYWGFGTNLTHAGLARIIGSEAKHDDIRKKLSWGATSETFFVERNIFEASGISVGTGISEDTVPAIEVYLDSQPDCDDDISRGFPDGLKKGLHIIYDSQNFTVIACEHLPEHCRDKWGNYRIENVFCAAQQLPIWVGPYSRTFNESTYYIQREISRHASRLADMSRNMSDVILASPMASNSQDRPKIHELGNGIKYVTVDNDQGGITTAQHNILPPSVVAHMNNLEQQFLSTYGVSASMSGARTAKEAQILNQRSASRVGVTGMSILSCFEGLAMRSLKLIQTNFEDYTAFIAPGKFDIEDEQTFIAANLDGRYDIMVTPGKFLGAASSQVEAIAQLAQLGIPLPPEQVKRALEGTQTLDMSDSDMATHRCTRILQRICTDHITPESLTLLIAAPDVAERLKLKLPFVAVAMPYDRLPEFDAEARRFWTKWGFDIDKQSEDEVQLLRGKFPELFTAAEEYQAILPQLQEYEQQAAQPAPGTQPPQMPPALVASVKELMPKVQKLQGLMSLTTKARFDAFWKSIRDEQLKALQMAQAAMPQAPQRSQK